jgi:alpha-2-macroglobulin receptor-associated protein
MTQTFGEIKLEAGQLFTCSRTFSSSSNLRSPFRVAKLNLLWSKAVHRLTEPKLKSLFTELKIHDKEELAFKHQKSEKPKDFNDGMKEAELRKKLIGIMSTYDLLEVMDIEDVNNPELYKKHKPKEGKVKSDNYKNKSLFKDKKLNKLWERAELGGFTPEELETLKEEFLHHEEKVQMYYSMLEKLTDVKDNRDPDNHKSKLEFLRIF